EIDLEAALGREAEDPRRAARVRVGVRDLDRPGARLGLAARPDLGAHDARAVRAAIHARLERVPGVGLDRALGRDLERLHVRADLDLLVVALDLDQVALVHDAHARHRALVALDAHV